MSAFSPKQSQTPQRTPSNGTSHNAPAHSSSHQEHPILNLQRTIGNQAVLRALHVGHQAGEADGSEAGAAARHPGFTYNFASIPVHAPVRGIQRKLTVNTPGDAYEQEADRVAEQVLRMPEPQAASPQVSGRSAGVQRECACGGTCDDCKKKNHDEQHAKVQMKAAGPMNAGGVEAPPIVHEVLRSSGQPLDAPTRAFMEPRFGHDFSRVRVHTDGKAAESAKAVGARAYTVGSNVVFGAGEYGPGTHAGQKLLGHELTHVVLQTGAASSSGSMNPLGVQREPKPALKGDSPRFEGDKKLEDITAGAAKLKKGDTGLQVTKLQEALVELGYLTASGVDGAFQGGTEAALKQFQTDQGVTSSGELDADTIKALDKLFETRQPYIDQAKNDPAHPGTRTLKTSEKAAAVKALVPAPKAGGALTFQEDLGPPKGKYGDRIQAKLTSMIASFHKELFEDKAPLRADPAKNFHDWSTLEAAAKAGAGVVDNLYGSYYGGSKPAPTHAAGNLIDQWEDEVAEDAGLTGPQKKDKASGKVWYLINSNCDDINEEHSAVPSATKEKAILTPIVESFVSDGTKVQTMLDLDVGWEGAELAGKVYLQRFKSTDPDAGKAKEKDRLHMWDWFETSIHEYIHTLAAPEYQAWAQSFARAGDDTRYNTLIEGFADFFTLNARKTVVASSVQAAVEGSYANGNPPPPIQADVYPSNKQAEQVVSIVGIKNAQAAYFGGKTKLMGKT